MTDEETIRRIVREEIAAAVPKEVETQLIGAAPALTKMIRSAIEVRISTPRILDLDPVLPCRR